MRDTHLQSGLFGKVFIGVQGQSVADHSVLLELLEALAAFVSSESRKNQSD